MAAGEDNAVEQRTVKFLRYHELLHFELGVKEGHGKYFKEREREFPNFAVADADLDTSPYQLPLVARIDSVQQDEATGEVKELIVSYPLEIYEYMRKNPLTPDDHRVKETVDGSGLGGGRVGTFSP